MDIWKNFNHLYADLYRFTRRMSGSHEDALDITQEAILRFARDKAGKLYGESARKWMFVVAHNLCISLLRKTSTRGEVPLDCCSENILTDPIPPEKVLASERNRQVEKAIGRLPDDMREVIILREYEGLHYEEISEIVKCPVGTVKSRLARARAILQKELAPFMEE